MSAAFIIVREGPDAGRTWKLEEQTMLGRGPEAEVRLSDEAVSREHAALRLDGRTIAVEDLESANGTFVNGERVVDPTRLGHGDEIAVGQSLLEVRVETREEDLPGAGAPPTPTKVQPTPVAPRDSSQTTRS